MKSIARSPAKHKCSWLQCKGFQYIQHLCVFKPQTRIFLNKTGYLFETLALKSFSASTFDKFIITVHLNVSLTIFLYTSQFWELRELSLKSTVLLKSLKLCSLLNFHYEVQHIAGEEKGDKGSSLKKKKVLVVSLWYNLTIQLYAFVNFKATKNCSFEWNLISKQILNWTELTVNHFPKPEKHKCVWKAWTHLSRCWVAIL